MPPAQDTIVAIATAPGAGGVGIVRLSGPAAQTIAKTIALSAMRRMPSALTAPGTESPM